MPMFHTPKPRQFRYQPRFYDPEKERWEALKQKYADEQALAVARAEAPTGAAGPAEADGPDDPSLAYFERRVRELDREERRSKGGLTWKDMFRKRDMPQFNYRPRFATDGSEPAAPTPASTTAHAQDYKRRTTKIKRRYDISDQDYLKPMPAGRIMLYALLVCVLLYWILF